MFKPDFEIGLLVADFEKWNDSGEISTTIINDYVNSMHFALKHLGDIDDPELALMFRNDCQAELENYYKTY